MPVKALFQSIQAAVAQLMDRRRSGERPHDPPMERVAPVASAEPHPYRPDVPALGTTPAAVRQAHAVTDPYDNELISELTRAALMRRTDNVPRVEDLTQGSLSGGPVTRHLERQMKAPGRGNVALSRLHLITGLKMDTSTLDYYSGSHLGEDFDGGRVSTLEEAAGNGALNRIMTETDIVRGLYSCKR